MYFLVTDLKGISRFVKEYQSAECLSLDLETTGLEPYTNRILLLQIKAGKTTFIFDVRKIKNEYFKYLIQLIKDSNKLVLGHNIKFDVKFLWVATGELLTNVYDTMLAELLINNGIEENEGKSGRFISLKTVVSKYCGVELDKSAREDFYKHPEQEITEEQLIYSALDVEYLEKVREEQIKILSVQKQIKVLDLENRLLPVVASMELNGIKLNVERWRELICIAESEARELEVKIKDSLLNRVDLSDCKCLKDAYDKLSIPYKKTKRNLEVITQPLNPEYFMNTLRGEFNIGSTYQLKAALNLLGFDLKSTGEDALNELDTDDESINYIKECRSKKKLVSSFGENFIALINPVTGKIHPQFNQLGAVSGRFSSENPSFQNITGDPEYRHCFIADDGWVYVCGDLSQEEYRLTGAISKEPVIIKAYKEGKDMHVSTGSMMNDDIPLEQVTKEQRKDAKPVNFSIIYGTTAYGMSKKQRIPESRAEWIISTFYKGYPVFAKYQKRFQEDVIKRMMSVTLYGRRRFFKEKTLFDDIRQKDKYYARIAREGFNHIIQGTAADVVKLILCRIYYENPFGEDMQILITVHDEIEITVKEELAEEAKAFLKRVMEEELQKFLGEIPAVAEVEYGKFWIH
jgi:DNA polymerase-1